MKGRMLLAWVVSYVVALMGVLWSFPLAEWVAASLAPNTVIHIATVGSVLAVGFGVSILIAYVVWQGLLYKGKD